MMKTPIVSVIVPVYNVSQYLDQCLDSLVNQTLREIEIICVNDASTDNSLEILRAWEKKDERIKVIDCIENGRQGRARNIGIKAAVGEFLGFVDSDDYVSKECYQTLVESSEKCDIVTAKSYMTFDTTSEYPAWQFKNSVDLNNQDSIKKYIAAYGCRLWCSIFRKSFFVENQFEFPEKLFYEDNAIILSVFLLANQIAVVDNAFPLYYYRINPYSVVHGSFSDTKFSDRLVSNRLMLSNIRKYNLESIYKDELSFRCFIIFYYDTIRMLLFGRKEFRSDYIRQVYREYKEMVGGFPKNVYMKDVKKLELYKLIGKYPVVGKMYLLYGKFSICGYLKRRIRKVNK